MTEDFLEGKILIDDENTPPVEDALEEVPSTEVPSTEEEDPADEVIVKYIDFLKENDLIDVPEDITEIKGTADELEKIFNHTKKARPAKAAEAIYESLPDDFKPLFEYAAAGGTSLTEYLKAYGQDPIQALDIEDPSSQKQILKEYYKRTTQYTDEKINRLVSYLSDPDDLKTAAEEAMEDLKELRQQEQQELIQRQAQLQAAQAEEARKRTIELTSSIDTSSFIHPQRKNKVKAFFFEPIQVENNTTTQFNHVINNIMRNPEHQAQLGDLLLEYDSDKGFNLERLEKKVKTKATQGFRDLIDEKLGSKPKTGQSRTAPVTSSSINWENYLAQ